MLQLQKYFGFGIYTYVHSRYVRLSKFGHYKGKCNTLTTPSHIFFTPSYIFSHPAIYFHTLPHPPTPCHNLSDPATTSHFFSHPTTLTPTLPYLFTPSHIFFTPYHTHPHPIILFHTLPHHPHPAISFHIHQHPPKPCHTFHTHPHPAIFFHTLTYFCHTLQHRVHTNTPTPQYSWVVGVLGVGLLSCRSIGV